MEPAPQEVQLELELEDSTIPRMTVLSLPDGLLFVSAAGEFWMRHAAALEREEVVHLPGGTERLGADIWFR